MTPRATRQRGPNAVESRPAVLSWSRARRSLCVRSIAASMSNDAAVGSETSGPATGLCGSDESVRPVMTPRLKTSGGAGELAPTGLAREVPGPVAVGLLERCQPGRVVEDESVGVVGDEPVPASIRPRIDVDRMKRCHRKRCRTPSARRWPQEAPLEKRLLFLA